MSTIWPIVGVKKSHKLKLFQERRSIRLENSQLTITALQFRRLKRFFLENKRKFYFLFFCLIIQALLEISLPVYSRSLSNGPLSFLAKNQIFWHVAGLSLALAFYLLSAFIYLFLEKSLIIKLINELREHWFKLLLYRPIHKNGSRSKAKLLAKVTYHFSLLQISLGASLGGAFRFLINFIFLLSFAFLSGKILVAYVLGSSFLALILMIVGYYIGLHYLSREASLSSAIITHISEQADQLAVLQNQAREKESLNHLRRLVVLDSELKVRRSLWMTYGNNVIFALLLVSGILISSFSGMVSSFDFYSFFSKIDLFFSLIAALLIRQLYLGLRIGLNAVPAQIGLALSLPQLHHPKIRQEKLGEFKEIIFKTKKFRLAHEGSYLKNIELIFKSGSAYLIYGETGSGKSRLSKIFSGQATEDGKPWIIKLDQKRFLYRTWRKNSRRVALISGSLTGGASIVELIAGESRNKIKAEKLEEIGNLISGQAALNFLNRIPKLIAAELDQVPLTSADKILIELAYCLLNKPNLIIIDNIVFDLPDPRIKDMITALKNNLDKSILVVFSSNKLDYLKFDKTYEINKNFFKENF